MKYGYNFHLVIEGQRVCDGTQAGADIRTRPVLVITCDNCKRTKQFQNAYSSDMYYKVDTWLGH